MSTLRIDCVDSFSWPRRWENERDLYDIDQNLLKDKVYTVIYNDDYRNDFQIFDNYKACGLVFENKDLNFLDTSQIISAKFVSTVALDVIKDNFYIRFCMLDLRPDFLEGYYYKRGEGYINIWYDNIDIYYDFDNDKGIFYKTSDEIFSGKVIEVDLTNSIDVIKRITKYGVSVWSNWFGIDCAIYGVNASPRQRPYIEIEYIGNDTPPKVTPTYPISQVVNGDQATTFRWAYSQDVNEPQSHYSIQQQSSSGWENLVPKTASKNQYASIAAGKLSTGQNSWRIMVWSKNGTIASSWSDPAYIIVQSQPKAPNITNAGNSPSPTFTWQASQQQGYEIILGDYKTGVKFGTEKTWTYPGILDNGNIEFQIRVQNSQGIWSPWASVQTYISNKPQGNIALSAKVDNNAVKLDWNISGIEFSTYQIRRDGKVIGITSEKTFIDYLSAGKHEYQVYGILQNGYYTPSNQATEIVKPKYAVISEVSNISWINLRIRNGGRPTYGSDQQAQATFVHYQGRELPVAYTTGFQDKTYTYAFSFLKKEDVEILSKLCGKMVILKTPRGERAIGVLTGISSSRQSKIDDMTFSITEADYSEVITNA